MRSFNNIPLMQSTPYTNLDVRGGAAAVEPVWPDFLGVDRHRLGDSAVLQQCRSILLSNFAAFVRSLSNGRGDVLVELGHRKARNNGKPMYRSNQRRTDEKLPREKECTKQKCFAAKNTMRNSPFMRATQDHSSDVLIGRASHVHRTNLDRLVRCQHKYYYYHHY